jgi:ABC-type polysaccharide/polyol phosphate export permease
MLVCAVRHTSRAGICVPNALNSAVNDVIDGFRLSPLWFRVGLDQTLSRFRRTLLGPFWMAGGLIATAAALSVVYGSLFGSDWHSTFPRIISGILVWFLIAGVITESTSLFISAASTMQIQKLPLTFHILLHMQRSAVNFVFQLAAFWLSVAVLGVAVIPHWSLLPGLALLLYITFLLSLLVGIASARFRDIVFLTQFALQMAFFVTPIFWHPEQLSARKQIIAQANPLWHMLEIVREPLLGRMPVAEHWVWTSIMAVGLTVASLIVLALFRKRVVFWV